MIDKELEAKVIEDISIPQYFSLYINKDINLNITPSVCSPFRDEDTPSFNYSAQKGIWKDFGGNKYGGNVISLHYRWKSLPSYEEAMYSLASLLGIKFERKSSATTDDVFRLINKIENKLGTEKEIKDIGKLELSALMSNIEMRLQHIGDSNLYVEFDTLMSYELPQDIMIYTLRGFHAKLSK